MDTNAVVVSSPWYRSLDRAQWRVLVASNLGWLFDGFEFYALFLTVGFAKARCHAGRLTFDRFEPILGRVAREERSWPRFLVLPSRIVSSLLLAVSLRPRARPRPPGQRLGGFHGSHAS